MAIGYDIIIIVLFVMFMANQVIQLLSLGRIVRFMTEKKWIRVMIYIILAPLTLLYTHDVFAMLRYSWG